MKSVLNIYKSAANPKSCTDFSAAYEWYFENQMHCYMFGADFLHRICNANLHQICNIYTRPMKALGVGLLLKLKVNCCKPGRTYSDA